MDTRRQLTGRRSGPSADGAALTALAFAELANGHPEAAVRHAQAALKIHKDTGYVFAAAHAQQVLDQIHHTGTPPVASALHHDEPESA